MLDCYHVCDGEYAETRKGRMRYSKWTSRKDLQTDSALYANLSVQNLFVRVSFD